MLMAVSISWRVVEAAAHAYVVRRERDRVGTSGAGGRVVRYPGLIARRATSEVSCADSRTTPIIKQAEMLTPEASDSAVSLRESLLWSMAHVG